MSIFESISTPEKEKNVPEITTEELLKYSNMDREDEEFQKWMEKKGMKLNTNEIKINFDGDPATFNTNEDDFGTIT